MHRPIGEQILSRNSESQYIDPTLEFCLNSENEVVSLTHGKPDIGKPAANTFGFIPKAPLQVYAGR